APYRRALGPRRRSGGGGAHRRGGGGGLPRSWILRKNAAEIPGPRRFFRSGRAIGRGLVRRGRGGDPDGLHRGLGGGGGPAVSSSAKALAGLRRRAAQSDDHGRSGASLGRPGRAGGRRGLGRRRPGGSGLRLPGG